MKTLFGAVAGALALGAVLVSYDLGARHTFSREMTPTTQMVIGPDGVARPYLVQAGQAMGAMLQVRLKPAALAVDHRAIEEGP